MLMGVYGAESFQTMSPSCHHKLSLLFAVFALACLLDQEKHAYSVEAQEYFYLSKAAFGFSSINRNTTLHAIQAMVSFLLVHAHSPVHRQHQWSLLCLSEMGNQYSL